MDSVPTAEEVVLPKLKVASKDGRLDGLQLAYWVGGGQPPPYYRSEQFRVFSTPTSAQMEFSLLRFDSKLTPNDVTETFTLAADAANIRAIASMLLDKKVFEGRFPEETNPKIGDIFSHEIIATAGAVKLRRTYYRTMPVDLAPLEKLWRQLIDQTRKQGLHSWYHQGRTIPDPFAGRDK
jgi:hypothetical protein